MNFEKFKFKTKTALHKNAPTIYMTTGIISMIVGTVLAVKITEVAKEHVEEENIPEDAPKKEKVVRTIKATWKDYMPAAVCEIGGILLLIGSNRSYAHRNANLANALYISETAYKNLQDKLEEKLPKKQVAEIRDSIAEDRMNEDPIDEDILKKYSGPYDGKHWFYDITTGQYFRSTDEELAKAFNRVNARLSSELYIQKGELLMELGENSGKDYENIGWEMGEQIEYWSTHTTRNGEVWTAIEYSKAHDF